MSAPSDRPTGPRAGAKWAIALVAVVALIVAFVALRGGDDEPAPAPATTAEASEGTEATGTGTETTTTTETTDTETAETETTDTETAPEPEVATVRVVDGQPEGGVQRFTFARGDTIRLRVVSDTADEVHVHGYDISKDVAAGGSVELSFEATLEGRFEVELEGSHTQIARLDVEP